MQKEIEICGVSVKPGEKAIGRTKIADMPDGTPISVPFIVVNGVKDGKVLFIQGCSHGEEITGMEIAQRICNETDPTELSGAMIATPVSNVMAYLHRARYFPLEERRPFFLGNCFPGRSDGFLTEKIAHVIFNEFLLKSNFWIDLHSGLAVGLQTSDVTPVAHVSPYTNVDGKLKEREAIARASGLPVILYRNTGEPESLAGPWRAGFFGAAELKLKVKNAQRILMERKIGRLVLEMGEGGRCTDEYIPIGVKAIKNIMRYFNMLPGEPELPPEQMIAHELVAVRPKNGGVCHLKVNMRDIVKQGDLFAEITSPFGRIEECYAPVDGLVYRRMANGVVYPGAELGWIAIIENVMRNY